MLSAVNLSKSRNLQFHADSKERYMLKLKIYVLDDLCEYVHCPSHIHKSQNNEVDLVREFRSIGSAITTRYAAGVLGQ